MSISDALTLGEIHETALAIQPYVRTTPIFSMAGEEVAPPLGADALVTFKLELLQRTGTFKIRGALSNMLRLSEEQRRQGVTAFSAGNHAIAVACAASILGISAKVVMLSTASPVRVAAARANGAEVLLAENGRPASIWLTALPLKRGVYSFIRLKASTRRWVRQRLASSSHSRRHNWTR